MKSLSIDKINVGDKSEFSLTLSEKTHDSFRKFSGDNSKVHTNDDFAREAGFRGKIAYGFNIVSYLSRFYGEVLPGGSSICLKQEINFAKPLYIGDKITIQGEVIEVNKNHKIVVIKNSIINQKGDLCISGKGFVKIII